MSGPTAEDGIERQLLGETSEIDNLADHSLSREFDRNRANFANRHRTDHVHCDSLSNLKETFVMNPL